MLTTPSHNQVLSRVGECLYRSDSSGIYYAIFKRDSKQIKRSLKTTDRELAKRRLEPIRQKISAFNSKESSAVLFADLAGRWLNLIGGTMKPSSKRRRETAIAMLSPYFKTTIRSMGKMQVETWAAARAKESAARTFNIERETLIQILDYAVRHGLILDNSARVIPRRKQSKPRIIIPTRDQFRTLVADIRSGDPRASEAANFCEFLGYSGCRLGEATMMRWGDVNFVLKNFTVTGGELGTKNHEVRTVPLFPPLERLLASMRNAFPMPPQPSDKIFSIGSAKKAMSTACQNAGLPHFTHHTLRHFFCSNAIEAGIDFKVIAGWLGHKDGGVLVAKTYGHLRDEHSTAMARRMTFDANQDVEAGDKVVKLEIARI